MAQQIIKEERSLGDLFSELANETGTLVRQEVALAQVEMTQKATKVGKNVGYLIVGGSVAFAAFQAFIAALIIGLSYMIPAWTAALLVGIIVAIAAVILIMSALNALKNTELAPRQTVETIKEDAKWLKDQVS
ncbi:phage holin family protein [soil metagenome]|jgi:predicted phage tail protein|nr:phage holin family protein [Acidobacteriota bacterium]